MPKIEDTLVQRIYKCTNDKCDCQVAYEEKATKDFRKKCPFCKKNTLLLESGSASYSVAIDMNKPKTFGAQSEINRKRKEKEEGKKKDKTPFWRKNKKIDYSILRNPKKFIETGSV